MTKEELNYIKDAFSQIIDDIAGNPDWHEAARAVASDLGALERKLEEKISPLPSNLDEAAEEYALDVKAKPYGNIVKEAFKDGATWRDSQIPELPSNLDEAAEEYFKQYNYMPKGFVVDAFKSGAEWMNKQIKMPNSTKLISEWHNVKTILEEKDFRGDEWRLAYNAFMFGFSRGINTQKTEK